MKLLVAVVLLVAAAAAAPAPQNDADKNAQIVRYDNDNIGVDGYNWAYETSNRISAQEQGQLKNAGTDNEVLTVQGQFSFLGPDGVLYTVTYTADEDGFHPEGAHLPKSS